MTRMRVAGCVICLSLNLVAFAAAQQIRVEIPDPGKTGLVSGWYVIDLKRGVDQDKAGITLVLYQAPSGKHHTYPARESGCERSNVKDPSWAPSVTRRRDGSLQLELKATSARGCKIVATIPAVKE